MADEEKTLADRAIETDASISELVAEFYGPTGPLVAAGWEVRSAQVEMSTDIAEAYDRTQGSDAKAWTVHEAKTGTGKGLAYLVPGILVALREHKLWNEKPEDKRSKNPPQTVVSTANIALQEQLISKDIPAIAAMLGANVRAVLMKGRNNYLCRSAVAVSDGDTIADPAFAEMMRLLEDGTWDGDKESLRTDPGRLWSKVSKTSDQCSGRSCPHYAMGSENPCLWRQAVRGADRAHVVVTNHHMLALKRLNACLVAVDEMHEMEAAIRSASSQRLTAGAGNAMAKRAAKIIGDEAYDLIRDPILFIMEQLEKQFLEKNPRRTRWPEAVIVQDGGEKAHKAAQRVMDAWAMLHSEAVSRGCYDNGKGNLVGPSGQEEVGKLGVLANSAYRLAERCFAFATGEIPDSWPGDPWAIYIEGNWGRDKLWITASASPADVSWSIAAQQNRYPVAAFTSATVPDFESLRLTYGMGDGLTSAWSVEKRMESPFNLKDVGVTIVPKGPEPKDRNWKEWASRQVVQAVNLAGGGALVLSSSVAQMKAYGEALRYGTEFEVKVQGEEGRSQLRAWFGESKDGILVATRSFFQGLDVQGDACRLVIIDRIPFARPNDPVEGAVQRLLVERAGGGSGYMLRSIPDAAMALAQGAGRLIRSHGDRGAVMILDTRILKGGAGWKKLREALPEFPVSQSVRDIRAILDGEPLGGVMKPQKVRAKTNTLRW